MNAISLAERRLLPDSLIRYGIRKLVRQRLEQEQRDLPTRKRDLLDLLRLSPLAVETAAANEQHYELPPEFFKIALGQHLKYSCCFWPEDTRTLDQSEKAALDQIAERAQLADGQRILELGCGWGSFSLWAAAQFPNSRITAVSNSSGQRGFIEEQARQRGIRNLEVITCDINKFDTTSTFDRIVSVEMFEHLRNYQTLFAKIADWLVPGGKLFVHVFTHKDVAYLFEDKEQDDWMSRYFFTGGIMPSRDLLPQFAGSLTLAEQWHLSGIHYQKTAEAWLENMDRNRPQVLDVFERCYGKRDAKLWEQRWRIFMMSCAELFGFRNGEEWGVSHYLFQR